MRTVCAFATLFFLTCSLSVAQNSSNADFDEFKIYGGYQYVSLDTHAVQDALNLEHVIDPAFPLLNFGNHQTLNGWNFGAEEDTLAKWFGVVVDVGARMGQITSVSALREGYRAKCAPNYVSTLLRWDRSLLCAGVRRYSLLFAL